MPTAANAGYYAEIVAEQAVLRRLVEAGTRIVQLGYGARAAGRRRRRRRRPRAAGRSTTSPSSAPARTTSALEDLLQPTMDEIEAIGSRGGELDDGVPTGFADLDELTNGLHAGQMIVVAARPGDGQVDRWAWTSARRARSSTAWPARSSRWR